MTTKLKEKREKLLEAIKNETDPIQKRYLESRLKGKL